MKKLSWRSDAEGRPAEALRPAQTAAPRRRATRRSAASAAAGSRASRSSAGRSRGCAASPASSRPRRGLPAAVDGVGEPAGNRAVQRDRMTARTARNGTPRLGCRRGHRRGFPCRRRRPPAVCRQRPLFARREKRAIETGSRRSSTAPGRRSAVSCAQQRRAPRRVGRPDRCALAVDDRLGDDHVARPADARVKPPATPKLSRALQPAARSSPAAAEAPPAGPAP